MRRGTTDLGGLSASIGSRRANVRMLLEDDVGRPLVKRLVADVAPAHARSESHSWNYGSITLMSGLCSGQRLIKWLSEGSGEFLGVAFDVLEWYPQISWQEHPSLSAATTAPLPWPFTEYRLIPTGTGQQKASIFHSDFLVGRDDAPSFANADFGGYEVLWGPAHQPRSLPTDLVVRVARPEVWIQHVRLSPTSMTVHLRGRDAVGARVELTASLDEHRDGIAGANRRVTIDLPRGLPSGAILLVSRNGEWGDHRYLDPAYRINRDDFSWEYGDGGTELAAWISGGEGVQLEFKREVPNANAESTKLAMLKTVSAFANGDGGVILFGVNDDGVIVGVPDPAKEEDRLSNLVKNMISPAPLYDIGRAQVPAGEVIALNVRPGPDVPYGVRVRGKALSYHVRRAGTTFVAEPHELRAAVLARQPQVPRPYGNLLRR